MFDDVSSSLLARASQREESGYMTLFPYMYAPYLRTHHLVIMCVECGYRITLNILPTLSIDRHPQQWVEPHCIHTVIYWFIDYSGWPWTELLPWDHCHGNLYKDNCWHWTSVPTHLYTVSSVCTCTCGGGEVRMSYSAKLKWGCDLRLQHSPTTRVKLCV